MANLNDIPLKACGTYVKGDLTIHGNFVNTTTVTNEASSSKTLPDARNSPFRFSLPIATPHFRGRQETLDKINNQFQPLPPSLNCIRRFFKIINELFSQPPVTPKSCWEQIVTVAGIGGIGKSEAACQFAKIYRETYPNVAWINAETERGVLDSFLGLAKLLGLVSRDTKRADLELVKEVYRHIDNQYDYNVLLIFDNAIQLNSDESGFGIFDYLPTEDLANQRFPFVIITSQTPDWEKGIQTFELGELSEDDSLQFFRSSFKIVSSDCDQVLGQLHSLLRGYPLAMNLAASNIDFNSQKDSASHLQEEIQRYMDKFKKEDSSLLTEKMNRKWPSKYNKTFSTVWQLMFRRLQEEPAGANTIKLLQAISFFHVPVKTFYVQKFLFECALCPGTPEWMQFEQLKESIRLLQRFYAVDCVYGEIDYSDKLSMLQSCSESGCCSENDAQDISSKFAEEVKSSKGFSCALQIHRLVQFVVRLQMDCSEVLEHILRFLAFWSSGCEAPELNVAAVEEALERSRLSTNALAFVGLLAYQGNRAAIRIVWSRSPRMEPAVTIWSLYRLSIGIKTDTNEGEIDVLRRLVKLSSSEDTLIGRRCFAYMATKMLAKKIVQGVNGIEDLVCELISISCNMTDVCTRPLLCDNFSRFTMTFSTLLLVNYVIEEFTQRKLESVVTKITEMKSTFCEKILVGNPTHKHHFKYQDEGYKIHNPAAWKKFDAELASCGSDELKLKPLFSALFDKLYALSGKGSFDVSARLYIAFNDIYFTLNRLLSQPREVVLPLISAFAEISSKAEEESDLEQSTTPRDWILFAVEVCSTWMKIAIQEGLLSSKELALHLSRVKILAKIKDEPFADIRAALGHYRVDWYNVNVRHTPTYERFIQKYSEADEDKMKTLVSFCQLIQHGIKG